MTDRSGPVDHSGAPVEDEKADLDMAAMRTVMASERTDLALIRTGFTAASFGAGLTQIIGRGVWPALAVDLLTILFILAGAMSIQIGLVRLLKLLKQSPGLGDIDRQRRRLLVSGVFLLQAALFAIIVMVVIHM